MTATRREQILTVARDLVLAHGVKALSMRRVAAAAGISATAIYRHYKDKEALVWGVVEEGFRAFASYLFPSLSGATPLERLQLAGRNYIRFAIEQPEYYRLIFMSWFDAASADAVAKKGKREPAQEPTFQFLLDRVGECIKAGVIKPEVPVLDAATGIWAQVHGLAALYLAGGARFHYTPQAYLDECERIVGQMLRGLLA